MSPQSPRPRKSPCKKSPLFITRQDRFWRELQHKRELCLAKWHMIRELSTMRFSSTLIGLWNTSTRAGEALQRTKKFRWKLMGEITSMRYTTKAAIEGETDICVLLILTSRMSQDDQPYAFRVTKLKWKVHKLPDKTKMAIKKIKNDGVKFARKSHFILDIWWTCVCMVYNCCETIYLALVARRIFSRLSHHVSRLCDCQNLCSC